jgi:acyl-CoA synthetase (AMP-forming)/AMP-acid ligase II
MGFMLDGELFVTGRARDLIIIAGANIAPEFVEDIARRVPGVHPRTRWGDSGRLHTWRDDVLSLHVSGVHSSHASVGGVPVTASFDRARPRNPMTRLASRSGALVLSLCVSVCSSEAGSKPDAAVLVDQVVVVLAGW